MGNCPCQRQHNTHAHQHAPPCLEGVAGHAGAPSLHALPLHRRRRLLLLLLLKLLLLMLRGRRLCRAAPVWRRRAGGRKHHLPALGAVAVRRLVHSVAAGVVGGKGGSVDRAGCPVKGIKPADNRRRRCLITFAFRRRTRRMAQHLHLPAAGVGPPPRGRSWPFRQAQRLRSAATARMPTTRAAPGALSLCEGEEAVQHAPKDSQKPGGRVPSLPPLRPHAAPVFSVPEPHRGVRASFFLRGGQAQQCVVGRANRGAEQGPNSTTPSPNPLSNQRPRSKPVFSIADSRAA